MKAFNLAAVLAWVVLVGGLLFLAWPSPASPEERPIVRVDQFDTNGKRTGYLIVDPKTGRIDTFDTKSRRTGSGQVQGLDKAPATAPPATQSRR
jgi:hypothetical protein